LIASGARIFPVVTQRRFFAFSALPRWPVFEYFQLLIYFPFVFYCEGLLPFFAF